MVISGNTRLAFKREFFAIKNLITASKLLIQRQKGIYLLDPKFISKQRKFPTSSNPAISSSRPRDSASVVTKKTNAFIPMAPDISMETLDDFLKPIEQDASLYSENVSTENVKTDNLESIKLETIRTVGANVVCCGVKKRLVTQAGEQVRNALLISKLKLRFERSHVQRNRFFTETTKYFDKTQ